VIVTLHLVALALYGLATALTLAPFMGFRPAPRALGAALAASHAQHPFVGRIQVPICVIQRLAGARLAFQSGSLCFFGIFDEFLNIFQGFRLLIYLDKFITGRFVIRNRFLRRWSFLDI